MKKLLTSILALTLVSSMSITAFAATNDGTADTNIDVNGKYQAGTPTAEVISVDIAWDAMDFTYTAPSKGTWNTATHQYENAVAGGWAATSGTDPKITLTNHSNIGVKANFDFTSEVDGLNGSFTNDTLTLATAEGTELIDAPKGETFFSVSGSAIDKDEALGTITVTVANAVTTVSTAEELLATADKDGNFKLANDIDLGDSQLDITSGNYMLDLNGHTLSGTNDTRVIMLCGGSEATVRNGSVTNEYGNSRGGAIEVEENGELVLENCKLTGYNNPLWVLGGATVTNCELTGTNSRTFLIHIGSAGVLALSGNVKLSNTNGFSDVGGTIKALAGTYNFDVSSYVDTNLYTVTNDGTTWIVTAK